MPGGGGAGAHRARGGGPRHIGREAFEFGRQCALRLCGLVFGRPPPADPVHPTQASQANRGWQTRRAAPETWVGRRAGAPTCPTCPMASHRELRVQEQEISPAHGTFLPRSGEQRHADTQDLAVQRHAVTSLQADLRGRIWGPITDFSPKFPTGFQQGCRFCHPPHRSPHVSRIVTFRREDDKGGGEN